MRLENMTTQDVKLLDAELSPQIAAAIEEQAKFEAEHKAEEDNDTEVPEGGYLPAASGIRQIMTTFLRMCATSGRRIRSVG